MDQCHDAEMKLTVERWKDDHFAILFTGGGNIGDLYLGEQDLKIQVMKVSSPFLDLSSARSLTLSLASTATRPSLKSACTSSPNPSNSASKTE